MLVARHKPSTNGNKAAFDELASLKSRIDRLDTRLNAVKPAAPFNRRHVIAFVNRLQPLIAAYARLASSAVAERSRLRPYTDRQVRAALNLLVRRSQLVATGMQAMTAPPEGELPGVGV